MGVVKLFTLTFHPLQYIQSHTVIFILTFTLTTLLYTLHLPWVTREVKTVLNKKRAAFRSRDREAMKAAQQEVKHCVKEAKDSYRRKVEQKLRENNMREVWEGVKTITGLNTKTRAVGGTMERANELNDFFNRFNQSLAPPTPALTTATPPSPSPHTSPQTPQHHPPPPPHQHKSSPLITTDQVRGQLRKLRPRKAAGPDKVCPRLLKTCAAELGEPLQRIFNLSLQIGRVPTLWKTSRIVPVPKKNRPSELNDFRPVALTSHLMKTLERLFLSLLRPQCLQYHPALLCFGDKLSRMGVDPQLMDWISDYLTGRPQYVGLKDITSDTVVSSTGAPQGTVLAPLLFTLYTSDFCYNSELCHIQKAR
ncbi:hypothetical protein L3Q82_025390 [Scortum barcoo]|uniref:Uncharacterized protein n=1 Tax=Scortum barcoo TaxID=214431 RepID=A0ACB8WLF6_9TELE|nr:hypothetical protein L3Q82_025390 [Scortum barcoo]